MDINERLVSQSSDLFSKFARKLTKVEPAAAALVTIGMVTPFLGYGLAQELLALNELAAQGPEAINAALAQRPDSVLNLISQGIAGELSSDNQNFLAKTTTAFVTLPVVAAACAKLGNVFGNLKDQVAYLQRENRSLSSWQRLERSEIYELDSPAYKRSADRAEPGSAREQFERSLQAFNIGAEQGHIQEGPASRAPRGPRR